MKVRCERDGTEWEAQPYKYPGGGTTWDEAECKAEGFAYPCQVIDCPTCCRGYFQEPDGVWRSDRDLTILEV